MPTPDHELFRCDALEKSFSGVPVLKRVTMRVAAGEVLCIAGENGAGKSTLMNVIGGVHQPDAGKMWVDGASYTPASPEDAAHARIAFVHQELNLFPNLSIAENIFLTDYPVRRVLGMQFIDTQTAHDKTQKLMQAVGLERSPATLVEDVSQGDRQLVEIAKALHMDARLIIFDEPTTSLTFFEVERLFAIIDDLRSRGIAILYISHALDHVLQLADRVVTLRDGAVVAEYVRGEYTVESLVHAMVGRHINQLYPARNRQRDGHNVVLELEGISRTGVVENITFRLRAGETLGIAGLMGSGRSELARIIFGLDKAHRGSVVLEGQQIQGCSTRERIARGLAFVTESRRDDGLFMDATVEENVRIVRPHAPGALQVLRDLHVACADPFRQAAGELSGGNQQKVALAKWLLEPPRVMILDEPTRGIDVAAKQEIYALIAELSGKGIGLLVISSEIEELLGVCDRILVMAKGEIRAEFQAGCTREEVMRAAV